MIKSIRYFLLISLLAGITIAAAINGIGNYLLDEEVIQPYLDSQLIRVASLVDIIQQSTHSHSAVRDKIIQYLEETEPTTHQRILFQVWDKNKHLSLHSLHFPNISLEDSPLGFSNREFNNDTWRIYSNYDPRTRSKIIVAEKYNLRRQLADDIARSNAYILLITYPAFGILVWFIISFALRSITRVTSGISNRAPTFLEPLELKEIPLEIKPLVAELNRLFIRLKLAFERNKRFSADAAHELRTPLAALKTHLQLTMQTTNDADRKIAFEKVIEGVDRSTHVVTQLLTLSRLGDEEVLADVKPLNLHKIATEIIALLAPQALEKDIEIDLAPPPTEPMILGNDTSIGILIRNIVDNAIRYTPPKGEVHVQIINKRTHIVLQVDDTGNGIPPELRERVFERFFRILGTQALGSGLGLAIVSQIAKLHHATVRLDTPPSGIGLRFEVTFPKYRT